MALLLLLLPLLGGLLLHGTRKGAQATRVRGVETRGLIGRGCRALVCSFMAYVLSSSMKPPIRSAGLTWVSRVVGWASEAEAAGRTTTTALHGGGVPILWSPG